jgi:hypothetical protein
MWSPEQLDATPFGRMGSTKVDLLGARAYKLTNKVMGDQFSLPTTNAVRTRTHSRELCAHLPVEARLY